MNNIIQFNANISKENDEIRIAFYANLGFFIEIVQMLEFNLRKLYCYHLSVTEIERTGITKDNVKKICKKYNKTYENTYNDKWTLGKLKNKIKELNILQPETMEAFCKINNYRKYIVHLIFQNNIFCHELESPDNVSKYMQESLLPMTNQTNVCNKMIISIINRYKDDLRAYKKQVGISNAEGEQINSLDLN